MALAEEFPASARDLGVGQMALAIHTMLRVDHRHAVRHELLTVIHTWLASARSS